MNTEQIWIGNDHGGYELKLRFLEYFLEHDIPFHDVGSHSTEIVRYPYQAIEVASAISSGLARRGVLICSSGIGMSIVANKFLRVRASLCTSTYMSRITRAHNDSNILCLGGMVTGKLEALDMLDAWLHTPYEGGRHDISLGLLEQAEQKLCAKISDTRVL